MRKILAMVIICCSCSAHKLSRPPYMVKKVELTNLGFKVLAKSIENPSQRNLVFLSDSIYHVGDTIRFTTNKQ